MACMARNYPDIHTRLRFEDVKINFLARCTRGQTGGPGDRTRPDRGLLPPAGNLSHGWRGRGLRPALKHVSILAAALSLLLLCILSACSPAPSVEQQIIAIIRDMEARVEAGERRPFMAHVAADFSGQREAVNRDQLNALVLYHMQRQQRLHAQLFPIQVTPGQPGTAEARFRVLLTGGSGWLPDRGRIYDITTRWRQQDDEWMLISAHWRPLEVEDSFDL